MNVDSASLAVEFGVAELLDAALLDAALVDIAWFRAVGTCGFKIAVVKG